MFELWTHSAPSRDKFGFQFLTTSTWDPVDRDSSARFRLFTDGGHVRAWRCCSRCLSEWARRFFWLSWLRPSYPTRMTFLIELLAAVPSVIFGLIGIFVLVPLLKIVVPPVKDLLGDHPPFFFSGPFYGVSILAAGVVLSVMVAPFIISVSREVLLAVPKDLREAALALGATRWETTWQVVVPYARRGIMGSVFLALARALGETMAVTMVVGNTPKIMALYSGAGLFHRLGDRQRIYGSHRATVHQRAD